LGRERGGGSISKSTLIMCIKWGLAMQGEEREGKYLIFG